MSESKPEEIKTVEIQQGHFILPKCCEEMWDNCPHNHKQDKKKRGNIGV